MLSARQSHHFTAGMLAGTSSSTSDVFYQHRGAHPAVCRKSLVTAPFTAVHCRTVMVWAGSPPSVPPARTRRKKEKSDTISMLREALDVGRRSEIDAAYQEGSEFLQSIGVESKGEVARILDIAMNPNSLFLTLRDKKRAVNVHARQLSVESDMKPVVACLQSHGLTDRDIVKIVTDHPPVLCYNPEERIIPFFDFLKSIGITPEKVAKRPTLLGLEVNKSLRRIVNYLQEVEGKTIDEIAVLLETI